MQAVQVYARHFQSQQQDHHDRLVNRLLQKSPKKMSSTSSNRSKSRNGNRPSTRKDGEKQNVMVAVANPSSMEAFDFALHTTEPQVPPKKFIQFPFPMAFISLALFLLWFGAVLVDFLRSGYDIFGPCDPSKASELQRYLSPPRGPALGRPRPGTVSTHDGTLA